MLSKITSKDLGILWIEQWLRINIYIVVEPGALIQNSITVFTGVHINDIKDFKMSLNAAQPIRF